MSNPETKKQTKNYKELYCEKLWPTFWVWVITISGSIIFGIAFIPINTNFAYISICAFITISISFLIKTTPKITVTEQKLFVGKAQIDIKNLAEITNFEGEKAQEQKTTKLNALAYLCIRGWIKNVVKINIIDTSDPTPYWLISSKNSKKLTTAIIQAKNIG